MGFGRLDGAADSRADRLGTSWPEFCPFGPSAMHCPSTGNHDSRYTGNRGQKTPDQPHANHGPRAFRKIHLVRLRQFSNLKNRLKITARISGCGANGFIGKSLPIHPKG